MDELMEKLQGVLNDKESLSQLRELAEMLTGQPAGEEPQAASQPSSGGGEMPDIAKLMQLSGALRNAGREDKNVALLMALRPLLKDENKQKLDRAVKLLRLVSLWPMIRESGLLGGDLFGIL